jgi:hypothetical protein
MTCLLSKRRLKDRLRDPTFDSATLSGEWFGSMTPPAPSRIRVVIEPTYAIRISGVVVAIPGMLWCYRRKQPRVAKPIDRPRKLGGVAERRDGRASLDEWNEVEYERGRGNVAPCSRASRHRRRMIPIVRARRRRCGGG